MKKGAILTFTNYGLVWLVVLLYLADYGPAVRFVGSIAFPILAALALLASFAYLGYRSFHAKAGPTGFEAGVGEDENQFGDRWQRWR